MSEKDPGKPELRLKDLIVRPHHTAFSCRDYAAARAFFVDALGFQVLGEMEGRNEPELGTVVGMPGAACRWAMLELGGYHIELFEWTHEQGKPHGNRQSALGYTHICFEVADIQEVWRRVTAAGLKPLSPPQPLRGGVSWPMYVEGPEGCIVEFLELRS
ncbi:MAG: VOC family protein [Hyphomicrobiaceae bacterium]|nr:VOC family protein [Hyphomicrobiaceae bacterium]